MKTPLKWKMTRTFSMLLLTVFISNSCSDPAVERKQEYREHAIDVSDPLYQHIVNDLGFNPTDVVDYGEMYIAEGDLMFNKRYYVIPENDGLPFVANEYDGGPAFGAEVSDMSTGRTHQTVGSTGRRVQLGIQNNITVSINANIPTSGKYNIRANIQEAINKWNYVSCSNIRFQLITSGRGRVEVSDGGNLTGTRPGSIVLDVTDMPSEGAPGRNLKLNLHAIMDNALWASRATGIVMHSLGHSVGFRHTIPEPLPPGIDPDVLVPQTTQNDPTSVFNPGVPASNEFSSKDWLALTNAYPAYNDCLAPFYYYWSPDLLDAFYTTQLSAKGEATTQYWHYNFQKIECFINTTQVPGTVPIYRWWSQGSTDHAYKRSATIGPGSSEGIAGYVYTASATGRVGLYEFYNATRKDHAYTVNPNSISASSGYVNQGLLGYVYLQR